MTPWPRVVVIAVGLVALLAGGCSSDDEVEAGGGTTTTDGGVVSEEGLALSVTTEPEVPTTGQAVAWLVTVSNAGSEAATLTFSSGQRADVVLFVGETEVYRWSGERAFTQVIEEIEVAAGESETFTLEEAALNVPAGDYRLSATLASDPAPPPVEQEITVVDE